MKTRLAFSKLAFWAVLPLAMFVGTSTALAVAKTVNSGTAGTYNWNTAATWTPNGVPASGDTVTIVKAQTVTVDTPNAVCLSLNVSPANSGLATLDFDSSGSAKLTVSGAVTVGDSGNANRQGTITFTSGSTLVCGNLVLGAAASQVSTIDMTGGGTLKVGGAITTSGASAVWTPGTGTVELTANNTLPATIFTSFNNLTVSAGTTTLGLTPTAVTGDLTVSGSGAIVLSTAGTARTLTVSGDVSISGSGGLTMSSGTAIGTLNVAGNFSHTGGTIAETSTGSGAIVFNGSAAQTYTSGGTVANTINFTVNNGATLMMGTSLLGNGSGGTFTLSAGGTLGIGDANGITTSGASGNIRVTGTRTYTSGASYIYNGSVAQVTGNGLPTAATAILNLTINNSAGVTLSGNASLAAAGTLTLSSGAVGYGGNTLTLASGTTISRDTGSLPSAPTFTTTVNVTYTGSTAVTTGPEIPTSATVLNNLTINKSGGVTLNASATMKGVFTLTSGILGTGANQLNLTTAGTISGGSSSSYVNGSLEKAFATGAGSFNYQIGDASSYTPVALSAITVGTAGSLKATTTASDHASVASSGLNSAEDVNRYWTLTASGGLVVSATTATFTFINPGDIDVGASTADFVVRRFSGGTWSTTTTGTRTSTTTAASGITAFGDFAIGEQLIDHYSVSATTPQTAGAAFNTTVTAQDILNQTVVGDNSTMVTMTGTGSVQFDSDGNGVFGDTTKALTSGTFTISTRDNTAETITLTATDGNAKTGTSANVVVNNGTAGNGAYRSAVTSGNWATAGTWERWNGSAWVAAGAAPATADSVVTIRNGHTVTVAANVSSDQVIVEAGGQVTVNSGVTWTIANGTGTDLDVYGTVNNVGTMTMTGTGVFQSGGTYQHNINGGTVITATWDANSTCEITGATSTAPGGLGQSFGNFKWNPTAQAANNLNLSGNLITVRGNLTVVNTGTSGSLRLTATTSPTLTIGGDLIVQGGTLVGGNNTGTITINVAGNLSITGGAFDLKDNSGATGGGCTLNVSGNVSVSTGATLTGSNGTRAINFAKAGKQTYSNSGTVSGLIAWTVNNGSTVDVGTSVISGTSGTFTVVAGGGVKTAHASGLNGNITVTGTKTLDAGGNYTYNGIVAQVTGALLPTTITGTLTIGNAAGVSLTASETITSPGVCTVNNGALLTMVASGAGSLISGSGTFTLSLGGTLAIASTTGINGNITTTTKTFDTAANYTYNNVGATQVTGSLLPATVNNLTINNAGGTTGVTLSGDVTVNGTLTLTSGRLTTGANTVSVATAGSVSGGSTGNYVAGNLRKSFATGSGQSFTFPIGDSSSYTPAALANLDVGTAGTLATKTTSGQHPNISTSGINSGKDVGRYWTFATGGGIAVNTYDVTFTFVAGDLVGSPNTAAFVLRRYNGSSWSATTTGTRTSTTTQATGLTSFSDFADGEQAIDHYAVSAPTPQTAGGTFSTTVTAQDILNQTVTGDSSTVVTMTSSGSAQFDSNGDTLFGDNTKTLSGGTFTISTKDNVAQSVTLTATDGNSKTGTSSAITLNAAAANKLAFGVQPTTTTAGVAISPSVTVIVQDTYGNTVTGDGSSVTIGSANTSFDGSSTLTVAASGGVATFSNIKPTTAGASRTLTASDGALTDATSSGFTVNPAAASKLVFTTSAVTVVVGETSSTITVQRQDAFGNPNTADADRTVTLASDTAGTATFTPASPLTISSGSSTTSFTYKDTATGGPTITAASSSPSSITSATQTETINPASTASSLASDGSPSVLTNVVVTFTATLSVVPPGGGIPTGNVNFKEGAALLGTGALNGSGVATFSTSSLAHGNHVVRAEYTGDGNYLGSTSAVTQVITIPVANHAPAAGSHFLAATINTALRINATTLSSLDFDVDGDALSVTGVSTPSSQGGTVSLSLDIITYTPANNFVGSDQFTYTISDGRGGTADCTANVTVRLGQATSVFNYISGSSGTVDLRGHGIPGRQYDIQISAVADFSSGVSVLTTVTAAANGIITYTDTTAGAGPRYYRLAVH